MSKIVACYKWVLDETDIKINPDLTVDFSKAKGKISDYDRNAIEAAVQAAATVGGQAVGLTFGSDKAKASLKDALARGLDEGYWINAEKTETADGAVTAKALAAAVRKIADANLVLCAEGASDSFARQTAPRLGAALDWPVITSVRQIQITGNTLTAVRKLDNEQETVTTELPAVVAVLSEINHAPIPGLKAVMAAGKKPVTEWKPADLGVDLLTKSSLASVKGYAADRKNILLTQGETKDKVRELLSALRKEGVL